MTGLLSLPTELLQEIGVELENLATAESKPTPISKYATQLRIYLYYLLKQNRTLTSEEKAKIKSFFVPAIGSLTGVRKVFWLMSDSDPEWATLQVFDALASLPFLNDLHLHVLSGFPLGDKSLKTWIAAVCLIDEARTIETKRHRELIEETLDRQAKHQNTRTDTLRGPSHRGNTSQSGTNSNPSSSTTNFVKLPPLTDSERTLLNEHEGCTKCRRFYTDHRSQSCPNGFPLGKGYKTLTLTDALSAKKGKAVAKLSAKPVAATSTAFEAVDSDDEISATAAILPDSPGEYTSDSDEDWDVSRREVSQPSLRSKHLIWNCQIHSLTDDFPTKTHVLIDNGAHLILIHPDLVNRLGLKKYRLHKPELVDVAFSKEKKKTELYHYVKLSLSSLDSAWTSRVVKAIVTPGLCSPVILGLPWLEQNFIVTDHAARTCIEKEILMTY
ncbi:hypothetical protein K443DRAFT_15354 [Laccaria amethystina LaAM-08-1]|uniref:Uncharacterized protein n=1 Tax=Laccaria amethystina LaAM-08-1 TaxID=1095629 RepID=A0A0C9X154_9AGAR|nr:hypothetical protein K443DRAFT_15354 [Laccaria amethystina LaAM-08-1]